MKKLLTLLLSTLVIPTFADNTTWLRNCAISPDGQSIAFSYKGDLFTVSSTGGQATRLTSNAAYDGFPHWSPDGSRIAFSSDRYGGLDVFVVDKKGGTPQRLTTHSANEQVVGFLDNSHILFSAYYMPTAKDIIFPGNFNQTYSVDLDGHRPQLFSALAMEDVSVNTKGEILYHNNKGYEDLWRKHHHSPITRDIFLSQTKQENRTYRQLTTDYFENRTPVWASDASHYYFLSEQDGNMNIFKASTSSDKALQLTHFKDHPVRYLSISNEGLLCFSQDGFIYTMKEGSQPQKVIIRFLLENTEDYNQPRTVSSGANDFDISNDEKEIAFVLNGDLYTTLTDYSTTKRLTTTPEEEKHPDISPDGRTIVYASERGGTWNIYAQKLQNKDDKKFTYATDFKEEALITGKEPFVKPKFSPDGKKIAFLANRTELRVYDVKTKSINVALPGKYNFSYTDGDTDFKWSPDSRWLLMSYMGEGGWNNIDIAAVSADGKKVVDLTNSGYSDSHPMWTLGGKAIIWASDRAGYRSHGSWGSEDDAYIMFLDKEAYKLALLNKEDRAFYDERLKPKTDSTDNKTDKNKKESANKDKKTKNDKEANNKDSAEKTDTIKPLQLDFEGCENRVIRLTINSSHLGNMYLTPDGKKFYYTARFEGDYDLWVHDLVENSTKLVSKGLGGGKFIPDKKGENIYVCNGTLRKITLSNGSSKTIPFNAEREGQTAAQREYIFDHCVNQLTERFLNKDYHGKDFKSLAAHYRQFLPEINNNRDFSEMVSELLGELNCSHTGLKYRPSFPSVQRTAQLGAFFDAQYEGDGLRIEEVLENGPLDLPNEKVKAGYIITEIDHQKILKNQDYFPLLRGKAGKWALLTLSDGKSKKTFEIHIKPIQVAEQNALLYKRWVKRNQKFTEEYSKGKIGYVHVEDMDSKSFRTVYSEVLGKFRNCDALVVDERHNGGGWLHGDLAVLLSGKQFQNYQSRGQYLGPDPYSRWNRPSCVMVCEDCYSNAHGFPAMYKALGLGKLVGTPMAGTMSAVWWERLMGGELILGIPEVECLDMNGRPLENQQLDPDVTVYNSPAQMLSGDDEQLKRAIDVLIGK